MDTLNRLLESRAFRLIGVLLAFVGAIVRLVGSAFPSAVGTVALVALVVASFYLVLVAYHELGGWIRQGLEIGRGLRESLAGTDEQLARAVARLDEARPGAPARGPDEALARQLQEIGDNTVRLREAVDGLQAAVGAPDAGTLIPQQIYESLAHRYGFAYESVDVECAIHDDGACTITRRIEVKAFAQYDTIDTFLLTPHLSRDDGDVALDVDAIRSLTKRHRVSLEQVRNEFKRLSALIRFDPPLVDGASCQYELVENCPPGTYELTGTRERLAARQAEGNPDEYFAWTISRPTRRLTMRIFFPDGFTPPETAVQVRFATASFFPSVGLQTVEQNRVPLPQTHGPMGNRYYVVQEVDYPMINLIYMVRWLPLPTN